MPKFTFISAMKATMSQNDNAYWTQYRGGHKKINLRANKIPSFFLLAIPAGNIIHKASLLELNLQKASLEQKTTATTMTI